MKLNEIIVEQWQDEFEAFIEEVLHDMGLNWRDLTPGHLSDDFLEEVIQVAHHKDPSMKVDLEMLDQYLTRIVGKTFHI